MAKRKGKERLLRAISIARVSFELNGRAYWLVGSIGGNKNYGIKKNKLSARAYGMSDEHHALVLLRLCPILTPVCPASRRSRLGQRLHSCVWARWLVLTLGVVAMVVIGSGRARDT